MSVAIIARPCAAQSLQRASQTRPGVLTGHARPVHACLRASHDPPPEPGITGPEDTQAGGASERHGPFTAD